MAKKPLILIIGGSVRNRASEEITIDNVREIKHEAFLYEYIEQIGREKKISNSEGCAIAAVYGTLPFEVDLKYIHLNDYYVINGTRKNVKSLMEIIREADGLIFSLPVYFGDRPSLFDEFIEDSKIEVDLFKGKVCAFLAVGAKRNGGQETTNVYGMYNIIQQGGLVVGNGPPTSQFGGTTVGGNVGTMENDYFGIMTSIGTGSKIAEVTKILVKGSDDSDSSEKPVIKFFILQEKESTVRKTVEDLIKKLPTELATYEILDMTTETFHRCFACNICPNGDKGEDYKCINEKDDMIKVHKEIISADGIVLCGLFLNESAEIVSVYQRFIERSRYIRRDDFLLTNVVATTLSINEIGTQGLFELRALTSFVRHNTIFHQGLTFYLHKGEMIDRNNESIFTSFIESTNIVHQGKKRVDISPTAYSAIGYE